MNSTGEIAQKFLSLEVQFAHAQEKILDWVSHSSFIKPSTWSYCQLYRTNLVKLTCIKNGECIETTCNHLTTRLIVY